MIGGWILLAFTVVGILISIAMVLWFYGALVIHAIGWIFDKLEALND